MTYVFPPSYDTQPEPDDDDEAEARAEFAKLVGQAFLEQIGEKEAQYLLGVLEENIDDDPNAALEEAIHEYIKDPNL